MVQMGLEAQMVIGLRTAAMMGMLPQSAGENARMVTEKQDAAAASMRAAMRAAGRGARADEVLAAAMRPYGLRTRANARRLTKNACGF
ncbi:antibiotic ABC transporter [Paracoccus sp. S-4012]|uniref:antibiotic ABC transporter n=1 Tax=Paracoccus sp. S-4012 TaxID=2665648 RepID=UPI001E59F6F4|nr:antibiotic ABC transporter [Paracoccus sp. S-4012]